jgi:hypothetical protein
VTPRHAYLEVAKEICLVVEEFDAGPSGKRQPNGSFVDSRNSPTEHYQARKR